MSAHLRADRHLEPDAADMLGTMFRAAYEQAAGTTQDDDDEPDRNGVA